MSDRDQLLRAADLLDVILRQSEELIENAAADNRKDLLAIRRRSAEQVSIIAQLGLNVATEHRCENKFRDEFSKLRSAIALHQASWSAVTIRSDNPLYRASVERSREAYRHFLAWLRGNLSK